VGVESCSLPTGYQISDLRRVKGKVHALGLPVDILDYLRPSGPSTVPRHDRCGGVIGP
jgi:hypothetical protein